MADFFVNLGSSFRPGTKAGKTRILRTLAAVWAGAIAILSLLPAKVAPSSGVWDKLEHALAFAVLAVLMRTAWGAIPYLRVWLLATVYGGLIELSQMLSPGRLADVMDGFANALGACAGLVLVWLWRKPRQLRVKE